MRKPARVLARDTEWATLAEFVGHPDRHLRLGVVSGRRRVGKSYLLRALTKAADGLYVTAVAEEDAPAARRRFAADIARYAGIGTELVRADSGWESLLRTAIDLVIQRSGPGGLLVIDELPFWMAHTPELPGLLQLLYDRSRSGEGHPGGRVIVCGSAMSVMHTLLSGTKALRGRAAVDVRLQPFDLPDTARHWDIREPESALRLHATLGGSPGYRDLSPIAAPQTRRSSPLGFPARFSTRGRRCSRAARPSTCCARIPSSPAAPCTMRSWARWRPEPPARRRSAPYSNATAPR